MKEQHQLYQILLKPVNKRRSPDAFFQNLDPTPEQEPTITALRELMENLNQKKNPVQLTSG